MEDNPEKEGMYSSRAISGCGDGCTTSLTVEGGDGEGDDSEEDDVEEQVDRFFAELDLDHDRQRRRLLGEGVRVCVCVCV